MQVPFKKYVHGCRRIIPGLLLPLILLFLDTLLPRVIDGSEGVAAFGVGFCARSLLSCRKLQRWDVLADEDHTYRMSESEYFHCKQNWWITLNKSGNNTQPLRNRSDFNQALSTLKRLPRSWRTTTQADAPLEIQRMETGIEFFFHLVAMERILVVFLRIQRKSIKEDASKGLRSNGATCCLQNFDEKLRRWLSRIQFFFCYR